MNAEMDICPQCSGSGEGVADTTCTLCNGSGGVCMTSNEPPAAVERELPEHLIERSGRKVLAVMNADPCPEPCLSWPCECAYRFAKAALGASTPPARPGREEDSVTSDSADYNHTFYGILNKQGKFWTPLAFHDEDAAKAHLSRWAKGDYASMLSTHKIVPVRVQLTARASRETERG